VTVFFSALALLLGSMHGTVMRGPTQPVCAVDKACDGPAANVALFFTRAGKTTRTWTGDSGGYRIRLAPGTYTVRVNQKSIGPIPEPARVRVIAQRDRLVNFHVDTGIR
jgi:hypothetical protein